MEVARASIKDIKSVLETLRGQEGITGDFADGDGKGGGLNFGLSAVVYQVTPRIYSTTHQILI